MLTAGPAAAINSSAEGCFISCVICATPPSKKRVMLRTGTPK